MVFSSPLSFVSRTKGIDGDQSVPDLAFKFGGLIVGKFPQVILHNKLDTGDDGIGMYGLILVGAIPIQYSLTTKERPNLAVLPVTL